MKQNQQFTVGLVAVAIALGAYMVMVESKKDAPADTKDVEVWSMSEAQAKDLTELEVKTPAKTVLYTRTGDTWKLASEPKREIDTANWSGGYDHLKNLTATRKVEESAANKAKYGLDNPDLTVRWGAPDTKYKLEVGQKNPTGDAYYVHTLKDDGIYTVASYKVDEWRSLAEKPPLVALPSPTPTPAPTATPKAAASAGAATAAPSAAAATAMPSAAAASPMARPSAAPSK